MGSSLLRHTGIVVNDTSEWSYCLVDILGLKRVSEEIESGVSLDASIGLSNIKVLVTKFTDSRGGMIETLEFSSHKDEQIIHSRAYSLGIRHIALTVEGIDLLCEQLQSRYHGKQGEVRASRSGRVKMAYVEGPEHCLFELVEEIK